ncbi:MAG: hypothetical protein ACRDLN_06425 [Solirubrobacteraceae bacterium]
MDRHDRIGDAVAAGAAARAAATTAADRRVRARSRPPLLSLPPAKTQRPLRQHGVAVDMMCANVTDAAGNAYSTTQSIKLRR